MNESEHPPDLDIDEETLMKLTIAEFYEIRNRLRSEDFVKYTTANDAAFSDFIGLRKEK